MELLKLVIVDDEPILLEGLLKTYDWAGMGFEVVGSARDGDQAIQVIKDKKPNVVLTDIRMKKVSGLQVMQEIEKEKIYCLFVVLSAYRDFEYAKQACDLGAFAYLLKPINDDELRQTMCGAYESCMGQIQNEEKLERWEDLIVKDKDAFLKVILQKYVKNKLSIEKVEQAFQTLDTTLEKNDKFITAYVDVDLSYKITNSLDYETKKFAMLQLLENYIGASFFYWVFESEESAIIFIIKALSGESVITLKQLFEMVKEKDYPVVAAISKPYKGIEGIKKSYNEAAKLFELACMSGASAFTMPEELEEDVEKAHSEDYETMILNAIRRNDVKEGGIIRIEVKELSGKLTFTVYNNGIPMDSEMVDRINSLSDVPVVELKEVFPDKKHGYGVVNIITRLRLKYGDEVRFYYEIESCGTRCIIQLPESGKENDEI